MRSASSPNPTANKPLQSDERRRRPLDAGPLPRRRGLRPHLLAAVLRLWTVRRSPLNGRSLGRQMDPHVEEAYLREILIQSEYGLLAVTSTNELVREASPVLFFREAQAFLAHAAAISRILWPPGKNNATAQARGLHLRTVLGVDDTHALRARTLRDHLEHFDERLDRWSQETTHGAIIDLHIGPTSVIGGPAVGRGDFLRVYEPERKVFTFRGDEFDMQALVTGLEGLKAVALKRMDARAADVMRAQNKEE